MKSDRDVVLILGAGINGCALARELLLNRVSVCVVDTRDVSSGATAASTRLIHGGLRYLEHAEFSLVRESLAERARLLRLAPQFVRPLEIFIPTANRLTGLASAARRFLRLGESATPAEIRGLWLIRAGLTLYDAFARDPNLPRHQVQTVTAAGAIPVDSRKYRWLCSFSDGQVAFPERLAVAMLEDARSIADTNGCELRVLAYHEARRVDDHVRICPAGHGPGPEIELKPRMIVNATGAWIDRTLGSLEVRSDQLVGGTKGSHFVTSHEELRASLGGRGLYVEASDGRPIFVLPLLDATLVGTTDLPFTGDPATARASDQELGYLLDGVNRALPGVQLSRDDIDFHCSGVRPLPMVDKTRPAAVTRRHFVVENDSGPIPILSLVGGKLTVCRSLAEETARSILGRLGQPCLATSRDRPVPGGADYPSKETDLRARQQQLATRFNLSVDSAATLWRLFGTRLEDVLAQSEGARTTAAGPPELLPETGIPISVVRWVVRNEWVRTVSDLVERRLMLLYHRPLSVACLRRLAAILVEEQILESGEMERRVQATIERLEQHFGKRLVE